MTQQQFEDLIEAAHKQLGFSGGADVQVGEYSAFPHGSVATQVIREGTIVLMDGGCKVEGCSSDITRTFVLGKPSRQDAQSIRNRAPRADRSGENGTAWAGLPSRRCR